MATRSNWQHWRRLSFRAQFTPGRIVAEKLQPKWGRTNPARYEVLYVNPLMDCRSVKLRNLASGRMHWTGWASLAKAYDLEPKSASPAQA